jgi:glutamyl/glutaminyl-tRNA synthetase
MEHSDYKEMLMLLRVALTGRKTGVSIYDAMEILGKDTCCERLDTFLESVRKCIPGNS